MTSNPILEGAVERLKTWQTELQRDGERPDESDVARITEYGRQVRDRVRQQAADLRLVLTALQEQREGGCDVERALRHATEVCPKDHSEQNAFEAWAERERFNMEEHPLHYIFMDPRTDAARSGWRAALAFAFTKGMSMVPPPPAAAMKGTAYSTDIAAAGPTACAAGDAQRKSDDAFHWKPLAELRGRLLGQIDLVLPPNGAHITQRIRDLITRAERAEAETARLKNGGS